MQVRVPWSKTVPLPQMKDQWAVSSTTVSVSSSSGRQMWKTCSVEGEMREPRGAPRGQKRVAKVKNLKLLQVTESGFQTGSRN